MQDHVDIHIEVPRMDYEELSADQVGKLIQNECKRATRNIQQERIARNNSSDIVCNADIQVKEIRQLCKLQGEG